MGFSDRTVWVYLWDIMDSNPRKPTGYGTVVIKEAMILFGKRAGPVWPPLAPLLRSDREELRTFLAGLGVV